MDVFCDICGHRWDSRDPGVRYLYGDGRWECDDEPACFTRRAMQAGLDQVTAELERQGWRWPSWIGGNAG